MAVHCGRCAVLKLPFSFFRNAACFTSHFSTPSSTRQHVTTPVSEPTTALVWSSALDVIADGCVLVHICSHDADSSNTTRPPWQLRM